MQGSQTIPIPITLVGIGKIARDQHLPAIAANPDFRLVAAVSRNDTVDGVPNFKTIDDFLSHGPAGAVSLCTPPAVRTEAALKVIAAGRDLMIEKPPAATIGEIETVIAAAKAASVTLFNTWHSRYAAAVPQAKAWIAARSITRVTINWREDVRRWHPNQAWIWQPGGFGVFDPGINALSIVTKILPEPIFVESATIEVPANKATPIAAQIRFKRGDSVKADLSADFDWRQTGQQTWDIEIMTADGMALTLRKGGSVLEINGKTIMEAPLEEYEMIYARFAGLLKGGTSDTDVAPLQLICDCFMLGRPVLAEAFV